MEEKNKYGIAWKADLATGDERVDAQHKNIFKLLNDLVAACADGSDIPMLKDTLNFLAEYTVRHFADEEVLQKQYGYPDYERHKKLHDDFKVTVGELVKQFGKSGSSAELSAAVNKVVVKWLVTHIMCEDKKIGAHIIKASKK